MLIRFGPYIQPPGERKKRLRDWYQFLAGSYGEEDAFTFMNYGYANLHPEEDSLELNDSEEEDRYAIQMYRHVTSIVDLQSTDLLEVGCGRGGGAAFLMRRLVPRTVTGMDFSENAIRLCKKNHTVESLHFLVGDAERLPFRDEAFDVVITIESSHGYGSMDNFLAGARRVLRAHGYLLLADLRTCLDLDELRRCIFRSGLNLMQEKNITPNVLRSLDLDHNRKASYVQRLVPHRLRSEFEDFVALKGTCTYQAFTNGAAKYMAYVLQKA